MDNVLYFEGFPPEEQPGPYVWRIPGTSGRSTAEKALAYYAALIGRYGGRVPGGGNLHFVLQLLMGK